MADAERVRQEAKAYLESKQVNAIVQSLIEQMLLERPKDSVEWTRQWMGKWKPEDFQPRKSRFTKPGMALAKFRASARLVMRAGKFIKGAQFASKAKEKIAAGAAALARAPSAVKQKYKGGGEASEATVNATLCIGGKPDDKWDSELDITVTPSTPEEYAAAGASGESNFFARVSLIVAEDTTEKDMILTRGVLKMMLSQVAEPLEEQGIAVSSNVTLERGAGGARYIVTVNVTFGAPADEEDMDDEDMPKDPVEGFLEMSGVDPKLLKVVNVKFKTGLGFSSFFTERGQGLNQILSRFMLSVHGQADKRLANAISDVTGIPLVRVSRVFNEANIQLELGSLLELLSNLDDIEEIHPEARDMLEGVLSKIGDDPDAMLGGDAMNANAIASMAKPMETKLILKYLDNFDGEPLPAEDPLVLLSKALKKVHGVDRVDVFHKRAKASITLNPPLLALRLLDLEGISDKLSVMTTENIGPAIDEMLKLSLTSAKGPEDPVTPEEMMSLFHRLFREANEFFGELDDDTAYDCAQEILVNGKEARGHATIADIKEYLRTQPFAVAAGVPASKKPGIREPCDAEVLAAALDRYKAETE
mmetsp:Transcript_19021/g.41358  ORF Transcript_19021/g.41358 Transcript_19021/m.41358 type:complete len:591 (-) Transcript_19021:57-1829(-)